MAVTSAGAATIASASYDNARIMEIIESHVKFTPSPDEGDWQGLPDLPTPDEVLSLDDGESSLPDNDKPWPSKKEYLEAHYKILRREGVEPLRAATAAYRADPTMADDKVTCIYTDVHVKGYTMTRTGPVCRVDFSTRRAGRRIKWLQSRRLTPGTVVAISTAADNFQTICKIATITQRPYAGGLDQNPPEVDITWADMDDAVFDPNQELVMVESRSGYFEAARHALVGLQHAHETDSPLDKYVVHGLPIDQPAAYIATDPNLDLSTMVNRLPPSIDTSKPDFNAVTAIMKIKEQWKNCNILEALQPTNEVSSLDESQVEALIRIVSRELAIIQGPPGTGKTFTSVAALKVLLANRRPGDPPIVVAAQTNHALDQLLVQCQEAGANILRIGGRTENEDMAKRTAFELRKLGGYAPDRDFHDLESRRKDAISRFVELSEKIFSHTKLLDPIALRDAGIINVDQYSSLVNEDWVCTEAESTLGAFDAWLGDQRIAAARQTALLQDFDEEEEVENDTELDFEVDPDLDNLMDENDEQDRLKGTWVALQHIWTGKNSPAGFRQHKKAEELLASCEDDDLYNIPPRLRGAVYQLLQAKLLAAISSEFKDLLSDLVTICKGLKANKWSKDIKLVEKHHINLVGCTTTGLTKYRGFLAALEPRTLVIEEAAETREANISSALYPSVQQLVLVGDHEQLTPNCEVQWLAGAPYNLNVSMFERLVNRDIPYTMLNQQRRMRPELRCILNGFYPNLSDHPYVEKDANRPAVPGMGNRHCWWFSHDWPEESDADCSKLNRLEAEMMVKFVGYLTQNGVRIEQITILTFYKGQRKLLIKMMRKNVTTSTATSHFNVFTVDSYQGEENDIVLLSMVRSPAESRLAQVGFLDNKNRAVVAISRARRGFYIFGNLQNALSASRDSLRLWGTIYNAFVNQGAINRNKGLPLICQNHSNETWFKEPDDFVGIAGGCTKRCGGKLPCGHDCKLACHPMLHSSLACLEPCLRILNCDHSCANSCSEKCFCSCPRFQSPVVPLGTGSANKMVLDNKSMTATTPTATAPMIRNLALRGPTPCTPRMSLSSSALHPSHSAPLQRRQVPGTATTLSRPKSAQPRGKVEEWNDYVDNVPHHDAKMRQERLAARQSNMLIAYEGLETFKPQDKIVETFKQTSIDKGRRVMGLPSCPQKSTPTPVLSDSSSPMLSREGSPTNASTSPPKANSTTQSSTASSPTKRVAGVNTWGPTSSSRGTGRPRGSRGRGTAAPPVMRQAVPSTGRTAPGQARIGGLASTYGFDAEVLTSPAGRRQNAHSEPFTQARDSTEDTEEKEEEEEELLIEF